MKTPNYRYGKRRFPYGKPPPYPIISRLTQGIHYQAHLCRCKTAAALCVTNGGETAGTHDEGSNTSGGNSSGDGDTSGGNMSDGGGSTDDSAYVDL